MLFLVFVNVRYNQSYLRLLIVELTWVVLSFVEHDLKVRIFLSRRVIETWFDPEYKEFFYTREPLARFVDMGDISEQVNTFEHEEHCCKKKRTFLRFLLIILFPLVGSEGTPSVQIFRLVYE